MPAHLMAGVYAIGIVCLFMLERDRRSQTSPALWIPIIWLLLGSSRMVSQWFNIGAVTQSSDQYLEGSPVDRLIVSILLGIGVAILARRFRRTQRILGVNWPLVAFLLYCLTSTVWSDFGEVAFKRWLKFSGNFVMVLVVLTDPDPRAALKEFLVRAGFILIPLSVLMIKYYPEFGRGYSPWTYTTYYSGVSDTKNGLGVICLLAGTAFVWCFLNQWSIGRKSERTPRMVAYALVSAMTVWLFWKADSATSFTCFILIGLALVLLTRMKSGAVKPQSVHLAVVAALVLLMLSLAVLDSGDSLVGLMGRDMTLTGRTELWEQLYRMHTAIWVGTGFESFFLGDRLKSLWARYWWKPNQAHNGYFEIYLNLGWLGVALFGLVLIHGYRNVVKSLTHDAELGRLRFAYFVAALLYNVTEAGVKVMHPAWIMLLLAATVLPRYIKHSADVSSR